VKTPIKKLSPVDIPRPVTIAQVAQEAGVSKTSVSRYLSGEIDALSETIRQKISSTIARLGYKPNQMARGLKRGRTRLIGMVVADVLNPYSVAVLQGAEAACQQHGYTLMLCNTANDEKREKQSLSALRSYSVEGLIIHTQGRNTKVFQELHQSGLPVVLVDRRIEGLEFDLVGLDNLHAGKQATRHLFDQGFEAVAFVTTQLAGVSSRQGRADGFMAAIAERQTCHGEILEVNLDDTAGFESAVLTFIEAHKGRPVALLAANGVITLELALLLQWRGLRMPEHVGLLGVDELAWSSLVGPGITTIRQPTYEIGFTAMKCLLARIEGEQFARREVLLQGELIVRGSSSRRPAV
jgi:LacI family kdg operon repressor